MRLNSKPKTRKDGGWKCETEGEGVSEERENGKQAEKYLAFYLLLIKSITLSVREMGVGLTGTQWKEKQAETEIINWLIKLFFKERWIDRNDTDEGKGKTGTDSERGWGT